MERHLFDTGGRVAADDLEEMPVKRWMPPRIGAGGRLIRAEPRDDAPARERSGNKGPAPESGTSQSDGNAQSTADKETEDSCREPEQPSEQAYAEGLAQGREAGHAEGYRQGLEEGRRDGEQQGLQQGQEAVERQLEEINRLATHLTHALNEQDYQLEQALLHLVENVARQVLQRELALDSSQLMPVVRQALSVLPPVRDNLRIIVHPEDRPILEQAAEHGGENWQAVASDSVERGGCRVETDQSVVDFTTSQRFRQAMEQIVQRQLGDAETDGKQDSFEEAPEPVVRSGQDQTAAAPAEEPGILDEARSLAEEEKAEEKKADESSGEH